MVRTFSNWYMLNNNKKWKGKYGTSLHRNVITLHSLQEKVHTSPQMLARDLLSQVKFSFFQVFCSSSLDKLTLETGQEKFRNSSGAQLQGFIYSGLVIWLIGFS